jgi:hypothetical protein
MMVNPFNDSTNISIRLLRAGVDDDSRDDRIAIVHKGEDMYHLYFKDADMKENTSHFTLLTGDELDSYLESFFFLLSRDSDPFRSIQFNIPCMPCLLYTVDELRKPKIRDSLNTLFPILRSCIKVKF